MRYAIIAFTLLLFTLPSSIDAGVTTTDSSIDVGVAPVPVPASVPIQNPWGVRPGIDSAMIIPAVQARQLTQVVMERNACVDEIVMYRDLVQKHVSLHALDSVSIVNLKRQVAVTDTLGQAQVAAASIGAGKWTYGFIGFGAGTILATISAVLIVILAK